MAAMTAQRHELRWNPGKVAKTLARLGIRDRTALAKRVRMPKSTIYAAFDADWSGTATTTVLAQVAGELGVSLLDLVAEPARRRNRNVQKTDPRRSVQETDPHGIEVLT
ncbi:Cro protein [Mycobacterium phage ZoeJ]|uniref:Cro protein n=1 Tax=Mycobacterium phage ZoeJ TaxID=1486427 RepID=A0A023W5F5_9CAUD|nr:transcriptional repressor [Mycobacterium phage ZoeJ]AHY26870.1 Cro protein [Mycobacterium phage ZoeJ]